MLATERGREAGYADLRSSLEESCNQEFAPMFRLWLNNKGIPEDFRQKYQGSAVGEVAEKIDETEFVSDSQHYRRQREGNHFNR